MKKALLFLIFLALPVRAEVAVEAPARGGWSFHDFGLIPTQSGGRVKIL